MAEPSSIDIYLEIGKKRTFASAIDWPGWCRIGRDEESALQALIDSGPRYAQVLSGSQLPFQPPAAPSALVIGERLEGNATTDFGAPDMAPSSDSLAVDEADLDRFQTLLKAYWRAFDQAVSQARGKTLRTGPRGGGRDLDRIIQHLLDADRGYLGRITYKLKQQDTQDLQERLDDTRQAIVQALTAAVRNGLPAHGPRGGVIWTPRYFVRRVSWHLLDHLWEIEDRAT